MPSGLPSASSLRPDTSISTPARQHPARRDRPQESFRRPRRNPETQQQQQPRTVIDPAIALLAELVRIAMEEESEAHAAA
jgi:hypothetical protein